MEEETRWMLSRRAYRGIRSLRDYGKTILLSVDPWREDDPALFSFFALIERCKFRLHLFLFLFVFLLSFLTREIYRLSTSLSSNFRLL